MKNILALVLAGILITAAPASAAPVEFSGSTSFKYEVVNKPDSPLEPNMMYTIMLKGEKKIAPGLSAYARLGSQQVTHPGFSDSDYNLAAYDPNATSLAAIDQYGLVYKKGGLSFNFGRQDVGIGLTTLLYNRPETNVGKDAFVEGLSINGKISSIFARENSLWTPNNSLFAIRGGYSLSKNTTLGATLGQYQYINGDMSRHWAVNGTVKSGKHTWTAEYTQSNNSTDNMAYVLTWSYDLNKKTSFYVTNLRVEANGDMGKQSEYYNNNRGFRYGLNHSFSEKLSLEIIYNDLFSLSDNTKNTKFETTLKYTF